MLFFAAVSYADDDCPTAAEAAEAQNPNAYKNCDYTKSGLNGVLHRALKENSSDSEVTKNSTENINQKLVALSKNDSESNSSAEFSTAQQLQFVRFRLIQKAGNECVKGFVIDSERYIPTQSKSLALDLVYHCL